MEQASKINHPVGVIGAGSFGTAVAKLLSENRSVLLFSRNQETVERINASRANLGIDFNDKVRATSDPVELAEHCRLIFPIVPSDAFRKMIRSFAPHLRPYHIMIHGTKGFDVPGVSDWLHPDITIRREDVNTMSQVIQQETSILRVGCLSGPNLASEILEGQPTATLIASKYEEVIELGKKVLSSRRFQVFGSYELLGAELAGVLKNSIAIGSGILHGKGYGKNVQALLINRGLMEMIHFGKRFGAGPSPFLGTAGIADLICTATSEKSRNFTFGTRLGRGESADEIKASMPELAEGVKTLIIVYQLAKSVNLQMPIHNMLYQIVHEERSVETAIDFLMRYPYTVDVDFI